MRTANRADIWAYAGTAVLMVLALLALISLTGCAGVKPPVVLTETRQGEAVVMAPVPETGSRRDVPVGVAPRDVVAKVETKSGAKVWLVKKGPLKEPVMYQNVQAQAEGLTVSQPKDPWWKWPVVGLVFIAVMAGIIFFDALKRVFFFWRRW